MALQGTLSNIVIDCADAERLASFWSELLGVEIRSRWNQYVVLGAPPGGIPAMAFQQVDEPKVAKNRMHVDFTVDDIEAATAESLRLGASQLEEHRQDGVIARVLADPEGNEFCLIMLPQ